MTHAFFATVAKGMEPLLADELRSLGVQAVQETRAGVAFTDALTAAYRVCLWSRLASRVLIKLAEVDAETPEALYAAVREIEWETHFGVDDTFAIDFNGTTKTITHTHFGALKVKDAIVDRFRDRGGARPSVALDMPDVRINVHAFGSRATLSLDLSGEALHRRGYRVQPVAAPLKETLAAAILSRADWTTVAAAGGGFVDPMCGSGTLPIEAAWIAGDIAPGLMRDYFGFTRWRGHDAPAWQALLDEAATRRDVGLAKMPPIRGYDADAAAVRAALANVAAAGLQRHVHIERRALADCAGETTLRAGLVATNPPYGERLAADADTYRTLGDALRRCYRDWRAAVFTARPELGKHVGMHAQRMHALYNGAIACKLLHFDVTPEHFYTHNPGPRAVRAALAAETPLPGADMFANRLRKNLQKYTRWAEREGVACYRLYDADMPEYAIAIDLYHGDRGGDGHGDAGADVGGDRYVHVQEYEAPKTVDADKARERLRAALSVLPTVLDVAPERIFLKVRRKQKGHAQYEKLAATGEFVAVAEGACRFWVNFTDYLDTGLFLDHRPTRALIATLARGKRFLNLFGYTGTASVHAALGGAARTTTVDLSQTYLEWARRNFALNDIGQNESAHSFVHADVRAWLKMQPAHYDLIFLDPPTFSTSKRMEGTLDIQRDHVALIADAMSVLAPRGLMIFSTNQRRFKLDAAVGERWQVEDITKATIPEDFARNPRIHQCWRITETGR